MNPPKTHRLTVRRTPRLLAAMVPNTNAPIAAPPGTPAAKDPARKPDGRFVAGHRAPNSNRGRKPGIDSFVAICRRKAAEAGLDFEDLVWSAVKGIARKAMEGDVRAAALLFDRIWGTTGTPQVQIDVNATSTGGAVPGPPALPTRDELAAYMARLQDIAVEQGVIERNRTAGKITATETTLDALL